jgi:hypothetical protein
MVASTKLAASAIGGLLLAAVSVPVWAGSVDATTTTGASSSSGASSSTGGSSVASGADHSLVGVLSPILADAAPHQAQKICKTDSLYSAHDVIGDPETCYLNRVNVPLP